MGDNMDNYGDDFQKKSKYKRGELPRHYLDWDNKPNTYKEYSDALDIIELPEPKFEHEIPFWEVITNRKSTRNFASSPISRMELSLLLYGMMGLTRKFPNFAFRTTPSAGGLYPIETYPVINNVSNIEQGIYHYNVPNHQLELLKRGDFRMEVAKGCLDQKMAFNSSVNFIWTAIIRRSQWKYLQRCYRYIYLDAGHIGQNLYLVAEALNLGACTIGAIYDDELNRLLDIDGLNETSIYVGVLGKKKG
ncbi:MAG: SagB/ThcOx family dehydrogenase [Promethearchaeota archaeon]|nr:MAG: SagB/ThcOx family dehydrogenase [Candidatus Lokiarchaeota archaeon]